MLLSKRRNMVLPFVIHGPAEVKAKIWYNTVYSAVSNIVFGFRNAQLYIYIRLFSNIILITKQLLLCDYRSDAFDRKL